MNFLPDAHIAGKIINDNNTVYFVIDSNSPRTSCDNGVLSGHGIEVMVVNPTTKYLYSYEFPTYEKFLNPSKFIHMHGVCPGSLVFDQLPLFHVHQTYPYYKKMFANENFDHYIMPLVGVSVLDYRYRFNIGIGLDNSQSQTVQKLSKLFSEIGIAPDPLNVNINTEDIDHDFSNWGVEVPIEKIINIQESLLYLGNETSRYEIMKAVTGKKYLPRFWNQREIKNIDLSEIICDNQMVLF